MKHQFLKKTRILIYLSTTLFMIASLLLLALVYTTKSHIMLSPIKPFLGHELYEKDYASGKMFVKIPASDFDALISSAVNDSVDLPKGIYIVGLTYEHRKTSGEDSDRAYINIVNENISSKVTFSFVADIELVFDDDTETISANVSNVKFGKYELPLVGDMLWEYMGLPEKITKSYTGLQYLDSIDVDSNGTETLVYAYSKSALRREISDILKESDNRKIALHKKDDDINKDVVSMAEAKAASYDEAIALIELFEQEPETFMNLCYLLNPNGIHKLYDVFGERYFKYVSEERLVQISEGQINVGLEEYHKNFSRLLLQYLYKNPTYTLANDGLYLNNTKITPDTIISDENSSSGARAVEIKADNHFMAVKYNLADYEIERMLFKR